MSRLVRWVASILVIGGSWLCAPLAAQETPAPTVSAEEALIEAEETFGPPRPRPRCRAGQGGEIVVCAADPDQNQFRIRSDADARDDYARETMDKNAPRAPDVAGPGIFRGEPTIGSLCLPGLQKCPPPPAIVVDFAALPKAPPGSDADRIARGLPPIGNDEGVPASNAGQSGTPAPD